jgi:hypothetical protein
MAEGVAFKSFSPGESAMGSMVKMAVFVVLGSAITVGALMVASYLSTAAG